MIIPMNLLTYKGPLYTRSQAKANVQLKSSIPIGAKVEISPKGFFYISSEG
jgi:hypothetical protein